MLVAGTNVSLLPPCPPFLPPPPPCRSPPLVVPRGGAGGPSLGQPKIFRCPFLPSFLSVQWHVMGTILGVMCLVFNVDFHFSKCSKSPMEQTEIVW